MHRNPSSHKGQNGKVTVIGGSRYIHGAPILAGLGAESSGIDLLSIWLPACHEGTAKNHILNCFVFPFVKDDITSSDVEPILKLLATLDCAVLGPGVAKNPKQIGVLEKIMSGALCPLVLDATALQPSTCDLVRDRSAVVLPHLGELERMELNLDDCAEKAKETGTVIAVKGETDHVFGASGEYEEITGGNAGLTVGGTGDVLSGVVAGLIAQGKGAFDAATEGLQLVKRAGEELYEEKGYSYTAYDVSQHLSHILEK